MKYEYMLTHDWDTLSEAIHQDCINAGWWKPYPNKIDRFETAMMLAISELSEALEGHRKDLMDDHLPHRKMFEAELADTAIRLLDSADAWGISFDGCAPYIRYAVIHFKSLPIPHQLYFTCRSATHLVHRSAVCQTFYRVIAMALLHDIDLPLIIQEKRAYNADRPDHKLENRENEKHGKKY